MTTPAPPVLLNIPKAPVGTSNKELHEAIKNICQFITQTQDSATYFQPRTQDEIDNMKSVGLKYKNRLVYNSSTNKLNYSYDDGAGNLLWKEL